MANLSKLTLGFLGCGKIGSAVCRGFIGASGLARPNRILLNSRSKEKCRKLAVLAPDVVKIASSNEELVRESDIIFLGLLPDVARKVLPPLPFDKSKLVVSMMAAVDYQETMDLTKMPADRVVRTVPLPSAANRSGPVVTFPHNAAVESVLSVVSKPVVCDTEADMKPMIALTGHISSFYELMEASQDFIVDKGVHPDAAREFVASFYSSLARGAELSNHRLEDMAEEAATSGGLNAQSWEYLKKTDHYQVHKQSLEAIHTRLIKKP